MTFSTPVTPTRERLRRVRGADAWTSGVSAEMTVEELPISAMLRVYTSPPVGVARSRGGACDGSQGGSFGRAARPHAGGGGADRRAGPQWRGALRRGRSPAEADRRGPRARLPDVRGDRGDARGGRRHQGAGAHAALVPGGARG